MQGSVVELNVNLVGTVEWFNGGKGYGFIRPDGFDGSANQPDVFVHFTAIEADGFRNLTKGDQVEFMIVDGNKGRQAANVKVTEHARQNSNKKNRN